MKRGFLNSKKARAKLLDGNGGSTSTSTSGSAGIVAPSSTQSPTSGNDAAAPSWPKILSEPVVGHKLIQDKDLLKTYEPYSVARIPSLEFTQSKEPSTSCIFRHSTILKILNTPGFYTPLPPRDPTDVVAQKNTVSMGVGLFAKRPFKVNQVIFSERPLLIYPRGWNFSYDHGLSEEQIIKQHDSSLEEMMQQALDVMDKEDVDAYMSLSNCHPNCPPLQGIARTNGFGTRADIEEEIAHEGKYAYVTVGRLASRINHDCSPNVFVRFDIPTFSLQVLALRDIKAGQQLLYSYCQRHRPVKERQRQLATYGFECKCRACANATPASDKLREEMNKTIERIFKEKEELLADPQFNIRSLDPLLELEKELEREGLDFGDRFSELVYFNKGKRLGG